MNQHSKIRPPPAYYPEASTWGQDRERGLRVSRAVAWIVAGAAVIAAMAEAVALAALAPLKTVVPYTLLVDRHTGYVQALKGGQVPSLSSDAALTQSYLAQYVAAREGFDRATLRDQYRKVALWSGGEARASYLASMAADNPDAPARALPNGARATVTLKSVSQLGPQTALVRFDLDGPSPGPPRAYAAVLSYRYAPAPADLDARLVNPLGFQVHAYHRSQESAPGGVAP